MSCDLATLPFQAHANYGTLMNNNDKLTTALEIKKEAMQVHFTSLLIL